MLVLVRLITIHNRQYTSIEGQQILAEFRPNRDEGPRKAQDWKFC